MKNKKKNNVKEISQQKLQAEIQKVLISMKSDAKMTRIFMVKTFSSKAFKLFP
jgi:hypothetical protein